MSEAPTYPCSISAGSHSVELRALEPGDAEALLRFAQGMPAHDLLFLLRDIRNPRVVAAWIEQVERGLIRSLVALAGEEIVACTALARDALRWSPHVADIRMLVAPKLRGTGFGRVLAQECLKMAMADGVSKLTVRLTPDQGAGQGAHVPCRAQLPTVGQAGGVAESGPSHADLACLGGHFKGKGAFGTAKVLGDNGGHIIS